jgi:hypothetical protein
MSTGDMGHGPAAGEMEKLSSELHAVRNTPQPLQSFVSHMVL